MRHGRRIPDIPFKSIVFDGIEQAKKMHSIFGDSLKAPKSENTSGPGSLNKPSQVLDTIMIGYTDNFYVLFLAGSDNGSIVICLALKRGFLIVRPRYANGFTWKDQR